jgi:hypothetical protein
MAITAMRMSRLPARGVEVASWTEGQLGSSAIFPMAIGPAVVHFIGSAGLAIPGATREDAPAAAIVTTKLPDEAVASVMPEQGQKENDRNRNAKKPKQDSAAKTHDNLLLVG